MALIKCPECGRDVSNRASACIHCGYPLDSIKIKDICIVDGVAHDLSSIKVELLNTDLSDTDRAYKVVRELGSLIGTISIYAAYDLAKIIISTGEVPETYDGSHLTVRSKKDDYIISKMAISFVAGASMLIAFFIGSMIGGKVAGLSFDLGSVSVANVVMSMLAKIFLVSIFAAIFVMAAVIAKQKLWLSILLSLGIGMLFFTMVPMITPLNADIVNVILCLVGGAIFSAGIGIGSYHILRKTSIV